MVPSPSIAAHLHSLYVRSAESFHRLATPPGATPVVPELPPQPSSPADASTFAAAGATLDSQVEDWFERLDADPAVQAAMADHRGPDGFDLPACLRSGAAGAVEFVGSFGLRSVAAGAFAGNAWVQSLSWFLAAAATVPLGAGTRHLAGPMPAPAHGGLADATLPSAVFLGVNLLHFFGRHAKYPGGTLAGMAQALGLSALTGLAVGAGRQALATDAARTPGVESPAGQAMLQRALLVTPVAAMSLYVFSRSRRGLPLRTVDRLGPLLLLSVVWCLRNQRFPDRRED